MMKMVTTNKIKWSTEMTSNEKQAGWTFLLIYLFSWGTLLHMGLSYIAPDMGVLAQHGLYNGINALISLAIFRRFIRTSLSEWPHEIKNVFCVTGLVLLSYVAINFGLTMITRNHIAELADDNVALLLSESPLFALVFIVFIAPFVEELLFRGVAFGTLYGKNKFLAYVCTAVFFSFAHVGFDGVFFLWHGGIYMVISILLCISYVAGHHIFCPIFVHMGINALSVWMLMH